MSAEGGNDASEWLTEIFMLVHVSIIVFSCISYFAVSIPLIALVAITAREADQWVRKQIWMMEGLKVQYISVAISLDQNGWL